MAGRTTAEQKALCMKCRAVEKRGGDVIAFLKANGYKYTTEAIWENMQKEFLNRGPETCTTGRPAKDSINRKGETL